MATTAPARRRNLAADFKTVTLNLTGTSPVMQNNVRTADPLNPYSRAIKELSSIKNKTIDDHEQMARLEYEAHLYHNDDIGPYIPVMWIVKALVKAGGLFKSGAALQRGLMVDPHHRVLPIQYDGPRDIEGLYATGDWESGGFVSRMAIGVQGSRTMRTRPIFPDWEVTASLIWNPSAVNLSNVERAAVEAGAMWGIGDGRALGFGRFVVDIEVN